MYIYNLYIIYIYIYKLYKYILSCCQTWIDFLISLCQMSQIRSAVVGQGHLRKALKWVAKETGDEVGLWAIYG